MPKDIDSMRGLHNHGGALSASPKCPLPAITPVDTSASIAAFNSAGIVDALSTFIAAFGNETHDTEELVDAWRTAASASDGAFWYDIAPDGFPAAHGPLLDAPNTPRADALDEFVTVFQKLVQDVLVGTSEYRDRHPTMHDLK
ncbi:hypothetical protein LTR29_016254 [Friedmanniomyces endolithicus]|nr:hypothetical protein LTS09_017343 [Friedmanniomyces endolithicus]KAK0931655.1 hypothetical protein LTR29_016254 [Friedmanniomyces endolithicus]